MIEAAVAAQRKTKDPDGLVHVSSHVRLAEEIEMEPGLLDGTRRDLLHTVYLQVMQKSYSMYGTTPTEVGGSDGPVAITFAIDEAGQYTLREYWTPRYGTAYNKDIRAKFPEEASEAALDASGYTEQLTLACYGKACTYVSPGNSLRDRIEVLFMEVASSPAQSSAPGAYIDAHPDQWQELIGYGEWTLRYCFETFTPSNQKGLVELLMALACEQILTGWNEEGFPPVEGHGNGSQWFNHFKEYAQLLPQSTSAEDIEKYHPGACLLLEILSSSGHR